MFQQSPPQEIEPSQCPPNIYTSDLSSYQRNLKLPEEVKDKRRIRIRARARTPGAPESTARRSMLKQRIPCLHSNCRSRYHWTASGHPHLPERLRAKR